jgi:hypothetical protein
MITSEAEVNVVSYLCCRARFVVLSFIEPWILSWWPDMLEKHRGGWCVYYKVRVICYSLFPEYARHECDLLQYWYFYLLLFFFWHYSPLWSLASSKLALHCSRSSDLRLQFLTTTFFSSNRRYSYLESDSTTYADNIFLGTGYMLSQITEHYWDVTWSWTANSYTDRSCTNVTNVENNGKLLFKTSYKMGKQSPLYEVTGEKNMEKNFGTKE